MLRMHVIDAVFKRNFLSYFSGVIGYLFIVAFVGLGSFLAFSPQFFANNLANLDQLNAVFPILLLFIVPAITMSSWADERKLGTDELLFTLPATDLEVLLGKYAAVLGVYTVALFFSVSHVIVLSILGSPDWGLMLTTYFGYWITGAAMLSAGMVASILTNSPTVAYVLGSLICAIPVFIDKLAPGNRLIQGLSVSEQFRDFGLGMVPLGGLLYFVSLTALMLYLNLVLISRRHWSGGPQGVPMWVHYLVRTAALALILISVNAVAGAGTRRLDLTSEKLFSVSKTTSGVLESLKAEHPITIQAFVSPDVPRELVQTRTTLIGLLRQYDQIGGNNLRVRIVSTERYTDAADEAKRYGIEAQEIQSERAGRYVKDDVYMGVVVTGSVDDQVVIPFFDKGTPVEYELTRSIRTVSEAKRKMVGILRTDAQVGGGFDQQSFRQLPEWRIVTELKKQYEVKVVDPMELATASYDVLLAVMPSSLTEPEMANLVSYVKKGKPTLIIDDPFPRFQPGLAPKNPKPRPGGQMAMFMNQGQGQQKADNGEARKLCDVLGIAWNSSETVWDQYNPHPEFAELFDLWQLYNVVYISPGNKARYAFNPDSGITRGLEEIMMFYPGSLRPREGSKLKFEPLLRTSASSMTLPWEDYVSSGFMGMVQLLPSPGFREPTNPVAHVIAAHITGSTGGGSETDGKEKSSGNEINVVFVSDMDMISNEFFFIRDKEWQDLKLDNIPFVLNAVDELAGDDSFLALRSRRPHHRTLERVEELTREFKDKQAKETAEADSQAKKELDEKRKQLQAEVDKIQADKALDRRTQSIMIKAAEERRRRELEVKEADIQNSKKRKIKESKDRTERAIRRIESNIGWMAVWIPPIPALLLGLVVFASRVKAERQGIVPDRLVSRK